MDPIGKIPNPSPPHVGGNPPRGGQPIGSPSGLLTPEHKASIDNSIQQLKSAQKEIDMAERAGLTTGPEGQKLSDAKTQVNDLLDRLQKVKQVYFPNG